MTPPRSIMGSIVHAPLLRAAWPRRILFIILILVCLLLTFFPERYRAAVTLTPTDPASQGLSGALGQLGAINSVFGNQAAVEVALKVARSVSVRETAGQQLKLRERMHFGSDIAMYRWMEDAVTIRTLRGGIIQYEVFSKDAELARDIVGAYAAATQTRLSQISRRQTEYKRDVLVKLVGDASDRLGRARAAFNDFRLQNRYANPGFDISEIGKQIPMLQEQIKRKQVELNAARQFGTDENLQVKQILAQIGALQGQLNQAQATSPQQQNSVGKIVETSTQAEKLQRDLSIAQSLYDSYFRYLEGTSVEDLTSTASVRILEPPFIDTARQIDYRFAALALALAMLLVAIEFYRVRPPTGDRVVVRETYA